jgi:hypothetical protein
MLAPARCIFVESLSHQRVAVTLKVRYLPSRHLRAGHHREREKDVCAIESSPDPEEVRNPIVETSDSAKDEHQQSDRKPANIHFPGGCNRASPARKDSLGFSALKNRRKIEKKFARCVSGMGNRIALKTKSSRFSKCPHTRLAFCFMPQVRDPQLDLYERVTLTNGRK